MKTKLLKKWRWLYKFRRMKSKFFTQAGAYRSSLGDLFFCWYIKHHHLYEAIKLECDILGVNPLWIWRENHPLHSKYAPSCRLKSRARAPVCDLDFASMYMTPILPIQSIEDDHDFKLPEDEDISKLLQDALLLESKIVKLCLCKKTLQSQL